MECCSPNSSVVHALGASSEMGRQDVEKVASDLAFHDEEALDWLGRPATARHGGSKTSFYILANQGLWNVANYAISTNLVIYFKKVLQMSNASAANNVNNWFGTMWLLTLLGGFMGDSYLGRFWTCVVFQVVHLLGLVLLSLSVTMDALKPDTCTNMGSLINCPEPSSLQTSVFFVAIYIIALGAGGYLPAFQALGADQFDSDNHKTTFFGWLFFFTNVGTILANTLFVWLENQGMWALGYWLATAVGALAFIVFGLGVPIYRHFRPAGNPFTRVAQVLVASARNWKLEVPKDDTLLYELDEKALIQQGRRKMPHTNKFRVLDKAATIKEKNFLHTQQKEEEKPNMVSGWKLCHVTQVEEVKKLWRILPIFLTAIPFSAIFTQVNTLFVEQATMMDTKVGRSFNIPPASMSVLGTISIFVFTILYPLVVVPMARVITHKKEGLSSLQRMAVGDVLSCLATAAAALLERERLSLATGGNQLSILWQTPQQVLMGASMVFIVVGAMDFFYTEAPHAMRGIVTSLTLANLAIGSYLSTVIVLLTVHFTTQNGKSGWIPPNLNEGHLDYFFWLLFLLSVFSTITFIICAWWFHTCGAPNNPTQNHVSPTN